MIPKLNNTHTIDDIEADLDIKQSIDRLLYKAFITLNLSSHEYNSRHMDRLFNDDKYEVVRELFQKKILSIKDDIKNGHPSLVQLQAEFGGDIDSTFEADFSIDRIQFNKIRSFHFIKEKITALTVHADDIIENDQSDAAKAKAWSLIAEANYLSGLLTAENLNHRTLELISQNNNHEREITKITKFVHDALDKWDSETILYKDIINTASTFMENISLHAKTDILGMDILDSTKEEYLAKVSKINEGASRLRSEFDDLVQRLTDTAAKNRAVREELKEAFKPEFTRVLKESNGVKWKSIYHAIQHNQKDLEDYVKDNLSNFTIVKPTQMVDWIKNKDNNTPEIFSAFFVNFEGASDIKTSFIHFLRKNRPTEGWSDNKAIELFQQKFMKSGKKVRIVVSRINDEPKQNIKAYCRADLSLSLEHWINNDDMVKEAFNGPLN